MDVDLTNKEIHLTKGYDSVNALRHTHASLLLEKGLIVDVIARKFGHDNSKITREIYLHVTDKLRKEENKALEKIKIL